MCESVCERVYRLIGVARKCFAGESAAEADGRKRKEEATEEVCETACVELVLSTSSTNSSRLARRAESASGKRRIIASPRLRS